MINAATTPDRVIGYEELTELVFSGPFNETSDDTRKTVIVMECGSVTSARARFYQRPEWPNAVFVDCSEWGDEAKGQDSDFLTAEERETIEQLRTGGRELFAEEVEETLLTSKQPDEDPVQLVSLQEMAKFLVRNRRVKDPLAGPSPTGIMQLEWEILGDGLLVIAFVERRRVHLVAQAEPPKQPAIRLSEYLTQDEVMTGYGHLIPIY